MLVSADWVTRKWTLAFWCEVKTASDRLAGREGIIGGLWSFRRETNSMRLKQVEPERFSCDVVLLQECLSFNMKIDGAAEMSHRLWFDPLDCPLLQQSLPSAASSMHFLHSLLASTPSIYLGTSFSVYSKHLLSHPGYRPHIKRPPPHTTSTPKHVDNTRTPSGPPKVSPISYGNTTSSSPGHHRHPQRLVETASGLLSLLMRHASKRRSV